MKKMANRNIKAGMYIKIFTSGYLLAVLLPLFFIQCNSHSTDKQANRTEADSNAFEILMKKFPEANLPLGCTISGDFMRDGSVLKDTMRYTDRMNKYTDALKFFCRDDKQWSNDPYAPEHPGFAGDARLPDRGNLRVLIYTRSIGDLLNEDSCATYITLSTFLPGGEMCDKLIIGGSDPLTHFECQINAAYNIHVSKAIFRDKPAKIVYGDTIFCKVVQDDYVINAHGKMVNTGEYISHTWYYFDPNNEGQFTKLEKR